MNEVLVTMVGTVGSEPKLRFIQSGEAVTHFRMVSTERRYDKETGGWVDGKQLWVDVSSWKKLAEGVAASITKGDPVVATGRFYIEDYEVDGNRRSAAKMDANAVGPDLTRCTATVQRNRRVETTDGLQLVQAEAA